MKLLSLEASRIILLVQFLRPIGQLYLPDVIQKIVTRYSFLKAPSPDQALPYTFTVGKFKNVQIAELSIYNDGLIVSSASDTDVMDEFVDDFLPWAIREFAVVKLNDGEKFYESSLVVKSDVDLAIGVKPMEAMTDLLQPALKAAKISADLKLSGFLLDFDVKDVAGKRKPFRMIVDRRINVPFSENIFFSQSPFRTKDHLKVLSGLEKIIKSTGNRSPAAPRKRHPDRGA